MQDLTLALVQTELVWEDAAANRERLGGLLSDVADADVAILPEMFSTGFSMASAALAEPMEGPTVAWMKEQARAGGRVVCGSFIAREADRFLNRFVWMRPDGTFEHYDKRHLFRMADEHRHYAEGRSRLVVELGGWKICPLVCYDLRFPVWSRAAGTIDLYLYVANWPARRDQHWRTLLAARAIENQAYVAGLNRVGVDGNGLNYCGSSLVTDFSGETIVDLGAHADVRTVRLARDPLEAWRADFPAHLDADRYSIDVT